jgi:hypothetical protein
MRRSVRSSYLRIGVAVCVLAATMSACDRELTPHRPLESRAPESFAIEGEVWKRTSVDRTGDARLDRLFRERKEFAGNPDYAAEVFAFEAPDAKRVRFYWVRTSNAGDAWTWIETDSTGTFRSQGEGTAAAFPGDG